MEDGEDPPVSVVVLGVSLAAGVGVAPGRPGAVAGPAAGLGSARLPVGDVLLAVEVFDPTGDLGKVPAGAGRVAGELFAAPMAEQPRRVGELLLGPGQLGAQGVLALDLDSLRGNR